MDFLTHILLDYGYWGMFLSALLAGSVLPFSSEVVLVGLIASGLDPILLLIYGTTGNVMGGLINYGLGRMGKLEWLQRYFHVSQKSLDRAQRFMAGRGSWMGFFAFLPIIGSAITVVLGLTRSNIVITILSMTIGKAIRYAIIIWGTGIFT
ncbi:YqaA family protein [Prevotella histicola]|jgi:putative membrane protein|uniref:DedA family protein n=1 Tax=Prevotella histicola TaxID=470565 RepID=A0A930HYP4_9BACT|nr:YqaA family protein [Prevotella histicola]MBF1399741.1 DedA family protein [Prevotella histicola]MBF1408215.1 DedA family protein [Prevotella histicola]MBF1415252.1 DedA family protein [Prevotella histicola]